ncbi:helix-turn-helix domain-containing protein [Paenibacillus sp. P25]|nr:helix-turn-helix domain-containing protein [Paenibacillus sp. P25]
MLHHEERIEAPHSPATTLSLREKIQLEQMTDALQKTGGNVSKAAKLLGVPRKAPSTKGCKSSKKRRRTKMRK